MANGISSMLNNRMRVSGISSGLDTETLVTQILAADKSKINKVKQDKQLLQWKQNDYRDITNALRAFKDEFFDVLRPDTNFRSAAAFSSFKITSSNETIATAKAGAGATSKSHSLVVRSLATKATLVGSSPITNAVNGSNDIVDLNLSGKQISVTLDGTTKSIDLENYASMADLETKLEAKLGTAFGTGKLDIVINGNKIEVQSILSGSTFSISNATDLGFSASDNTSNKISLNAGLDSIEGHFTNLVDFDAAANVQFTINDVVINVGKTFADATISDIMTAVNTSSAGVEMTYDSLNDKFNLVSKQTGAAETITYSDTDGANGLLKALGITTGVLTNGQDAEFDLDGVTNMKRSTNEFTVDGVSYKLNKADAGTTVTIDISADTDSLVDKIKSFVSKYNEVIDKVNSKLIEKRERSYLPLTDDQREAMSESDIEKWESKAKAGLLANDSILNSIANDMRLALGESVQGVSTTLAQIGITTGSYLTRGKLVIDEDKLRNAINNNVDTVTQLFTKESQYTYSDGLNDSSKRSTRYTESGLAHRLFDIIQDNIRTSRNDAGQKGLLLEKAGITGDISDIQNTLANALSEKDTLISTLLDKMYNKENALYTKFTAMERALSQMNNQSSWLSQQAGGQ